MCSGSTLTRPPNRISTSATCCAWCATSYAASYLLSISPVPRLPWPATAIGTGKDIAATLRFAAEQPAVWHELLERICLATIDFLNTLADDGGELYQLFDSWAGELSPADYARYAQAYHQRIFAAANRVPRVLFVKECPYLEAMTQSGADVISLGVRHDLAAARRQYPHLVFQGNVDEDLLRSGTIEQIRAATQACLAAGGGHRHIVNLSHGVDRDTPPDHFAAYVQAARAGL
jgi:uroporphyrinogen decarboxylase